MDYENIKDFVFKNINPKNIKKIYTKCVRGFYKYYIKINQYIIINNVLTYLEISLYKCNMYCSKSVYIRNYILDYTNNRDDYKKLQNYTMNDLEKIVKTFRESKLMIKQLCIYETDLLKQCILCKKYLSSQQWSNILENKVKKIFNIHDKLNNTSGDGFVNKNNIEIKISLGDTNGTFNFVQIRPGHSINYYLFLIYNVFETKLGKIYWFLIPSDDISVLLEKYGSYAHGTIKKMGVISSQSINENTNYEYSLRPNPITKDKKKQLWNEMMKYNKSEYEIKNILHNGIN